MPREVGPDERLKELAKEVRALGEGHGHIHWQWADEIDKQVDRWREADAAWESEHGEHALPQERRMNKLQRWTWTEQDEDSCTFEAASDGEWVKYKDVEQMLLSTLGYEVSPLRFAVSPPQSDRGEGEE